MYEVRFYQGDYAERQQAANRDECDAYVEHHFNSTGDGVASYACVVVGANASNTSRNWGRWYARSVADSFGIRIGGEQGLLIGGYNGRGDGNVRFTRMPAILVEPLFASNPEHAAWIKTAAGQARLAQVLADSVRRFFPDGGRIGFSVGHKYKISNPNDRGAAVYGGGTEADYAEIVLKQAKALLERVRRPAAPRPFAVYINNRESWRYEADADALVRWDEARGILFVDEPGALSPEPPPSPQRRARAGARAKQAQAKQTVATRTRSKQSAAKQVRAKALHMEQTRADVKRPTRSASRRGVLRPRAVEAKLPQRKARRRRAAQD